MDACLKLLFAISLFNLFGFSHGYFQWSVQHEATMCLGGNVNLIWDYTTNETTSIVLWEKLGSPNILVARIFGGKFNAIAPYNGRVTQTNLGNAAILISSVTTNDSGTYGCTIQSAHSENITLVVAETPSGLPYFNKTEKSLTCNPPQNLGSPNVETKLKFQNGTAKSALTATESGTYQCCIIGDAVKCLSSASNAATEACVNETLGITTEEASTAAAATTNFTNKSNQHHSSSSSTSASTNSISVTTAVQNSNKNGSSKKSYTTYIIIGCVGGSALLVLLGLVVVVRRRKFTLKSDSLQNTEQ